MVTVSGRRASTATWNAGLPPPVLIPPRARRTPDPLPIQLRPAHRERVRLVDVHEPDHRATSYPHERIRGPAVPHLPEPVPAAAGGEPLPEPAGPGRRLERGPGQDERHLPGRRHPLHRLVHEHVRQVGLAGRHPGRPAPRMVQPGTRHPRRHRAPVAVAEVPPGDPRRVADEAFRGRQLRAAQDEVSPGDPDRRRGGRPAGGQPHVQPGHQHRQRVQVRSPQPGRVVATRQQRHQEPAVATRRVGDRPTGRQLVDDPVNQPPGRVVLAQPVPQVGRHHPAVAFPDLPGGVKERALTEPRDPIGLAAPQQLRGHPLVPYQQPVRQPPPCARRPYHRGEPGRDAAVPGQEGRFRRAAAQRSQAGPLPLPHRKQQPVQLDRAPLTVHARTLPDPPSIRPEPVRVENRQR
jgi:hypothetical protein